MILAFVGLGQMGKPMAINMLKSGAELIVYSASGGSYAELAELGALPTDKLARVAEADVVFLSLPSGRVVRQVLAGPGGIAESVRAGAVIVDTSTSDYATTLEMVALLKSKNAGFVDAPVSGMESRAIDGTLTAMCGGEEATLALVKPYLALVANNILHVGPPGAGQLAKLINQLLFDVNCAALAEILPMATKLGIDPGQMGKIVNSGTGKSHASEFFIPRILENNFSSGYPMKHAYKDLISGADIGARMGVPMPVLAAATATYQTALLQGYGDFDKGAMIRVYETLLGVAFRATATQGAA